MIISIKDTPIRVDIKAKYVAVGLGLIAAYLAGKRTVPEKFNVGTVVIKDAQPWPMM